MSNSVEVVGAQQVVIQETSAQSVEIIAPTQPAVVQVITAGPQGATGADGGGIPAGGDPGNVLVKNSYSNYDSAWSAVVDGGTFN